MKCEPYQIYRSMMLEVKVRLRAIDKVLNTQSYFSSSLDTEFCYLQVRKIVEQVCFATIVCDQKRYRDFRKAEGMTDDKDTGAYEKDWNARTILCKLKEISPHFLPVPIGEKTTNNEIHHLQRADVEVTHCKLIKIYKESGGLLHIPKPFGTDYVSHIEQQRSKYSNARLMVSEYTEYLKSLLWHHAAIGLEYIEGDILESVNDASPQSAWLVNFGNTDDDNIDIVVAVASSSS